MTASLIVCFVLATVAAAADVADGVADSAGFY